MKGNTFAKHSGTFGSCGGLQKKKKRKEKEKDEFIISK